MCRDCTNDPEELETCSLCLTEVPLVSLRRVTLPSGDVWEHACASCRAEVRPVNRG